MPSVRWILSLMLCAAPVWSASQVEKAWSTYGGNGFFTWDATETSAYASQKSRRDSRTQSFFWHSPKERVSIERIDLDKRWEIDPKHRRYTEESISEANARLQKEMDKQHEEWEKAQKKNAGKQEEPDYRIKSIQSTVTGPGAKTVINGFDCAPYLVKTVIEYERVKDHAPAGKQVLYEKEWTSGSPALAQYQNDELAFWKSAVNTMVGNPYIKQLQDAMKQEIDKAQHDPSQNPWLAQVKELEKVKGYPVRTLMSFTFVIAGDSAARGAASAASTPSSSSDDGGLVHASDLSGGVGGLMSGMASRWASKKASEKVAAKMSEHPAWVDEARKDLDEAPVGWAFMTEIKSAKPNAAPDLFEVPAGYKKVKSL